MRNTLLTIVAALSLITLGLAAEETRQEARHQTNMSMMQNCPMKVPGTDLAVADTENGIILNITTKAGDVSELRRRVENMAKMHSASSTTAIHGNMMPFSVKYEEIDYGAHLTLTPKDPAQLDVFRTTVRQHAEQMTKGECSMMQGMMNGMLDGMKRPESKTAPEPKSKPEVEDHSAHHPQGEKK